MELNFDHATEMSTRLFTTLQHLGTNKGRLLVKRVRHSRNGLEAWRLLSRSFDPVSDISADDLGERIMAFHWPKKEDDCPQAVE